MRSIHRPSVYVDASPAGDQTYDARGSSRPFTPTHRRQLKRQSSNQVSYRDIGKTKRRRTNRRFEALFDSFEWELRRPPITRLNPKIYIGSGVIGGLCTIFIGAGALSSYFFPPSAPAAPTNYAAAQTSTDDSTDPPTDPPAADGTPEEADVSQPLPTAAETPAVSGINKNTVALYVAAAKTCNMPWQVLAGVGRVETNHGTSTAPGVQDGANYAGAMGPMQFLQGTWDKYGVDADHDGKADVYDQTDAIYGAANYLCANGARDSSDLDNAIFHYNHSNDYVALVEQTAAAYADNAYVAPLPHVVIANIDLSRPHHDYPAIDIPVSVGTPVFAVHKGTVHLINDSACGNGVELDGTDGITYTYCHGSHLDASDGSTVVAGTQIMESGGQPGQSGSGDSTGPHLHFALTVNGSNVCPQSLLASWSSGDYADPHYDHSTTCTY